MKLNVIVAYDRRNGGIGDDNGLMWRLSGDINNFKSITTGGIVVMGRKTWETIPDKFKPLPNRTNIILSSNASELRQKPEFQQENVSVFSSLDELFECYLKNITDKNIFIIGGGTIYTQILTDYSHLIDRIYTTEVYNVPKTVEYTSNFPMKSMKSKAPKLAKSKARVSCIEVHSLIRSHSFSIFFAEYRIELLRIVSFPVCVSQSSIRL